MQGLIPENKVRFMKKLIVLLILLFPLLVFGAKRRYVVLKKGETLWRIAKRYNVSVKTLQKINKIKNVSKINAGTRIYLPYTKKNAKKIKKESMPKYSRLNIKLTHPVKGKILNNFNEGRNVVQYNGIEYITKKNTKVSSALSGTVKYTGNMRGYGNIVIIQHSKSVATIYAYLNKIKVKTGQKVQRNHVIGLTGKSSSKNQYILHFELLRNGKPVDPKYYF